MRAYLGAQLLGDGLLEALRRNVSIDDELRPEAADLHGRLSDHRIGMGGEILVLAHACADLDRRLPPRPARRLAVGELPQHHDVGSDVGAGLIAESPIGQPHGRRQLGSRGKVAARAVEGFVERAARGHERHGAAWLDRVEGAGEVEVVQHHGRMPGAGDAHARERHVADGGVERPRLHAHFGEVRARHVGLRHEGGAHGRRRGVDLHGVHLAGVQEPFGGVSQYVAGARARLQHAPAGEAHLLQCRPQAASDAGGGVEGREDRCGRRAALVVGQQLVHLLAGGGPLRLVRERVGGAAPAGESGEGAPVLLV